MTNLDRKRQRVTISGAGSTRTPALVGTLMSMKERFPLKEIIFYDPNLERLEKIEDYIKLLFKNLSPETNVVFTDNTELAYSNTDFVFCQMRVGLSEMRSYDEKIPLKYGCVGQETCGAGGFAYGMRSIGAMIEMVNTVRSYSQDTWILNYTNPAAIVAVALDKVFPNDKRIINICDQPYSMLVSFAKILGVDSKTLRTEYFGLNHFGWFTKLYDTNGVDYYETLKTYLMGNDFKPYNAEQRTKSWLDTYLRVNKMMKLMPEFIPTTYLQYYFYQDEIVEESDSNFTRADETILTREKEVWDVCSKAVGKETLDDIEVLTNSVFGSMMIEVAESIAYDLGNEFVVIVKNDGYITNFNPNAMVEVAGHLNKDGVQGKVYGEIKPFYKGLMENQYAYELLTVEAYLEKSYLKALQALTLNRAVNSIEKAKLILDDLIEVNKEYWTLN